MLLLLALGVPQRPLAALAQLKALEVLLTLQNVDGGWATYENTRGPALLVLPLVASGHEASYRGVVGLAVLRKPEITK